MPGIAGVITNMPPRRADELARRMLQTMCHESFYETRSWSDESLGVYVGWVGRKSVPPQDVPLWNEGRDVCLVLSGEEFAEPGTARRLRERGHSVESEGRACLVHRYEESPGHFIAGLNGRFHGVLADCRQRTVTLFNDRYGLHRLYYHKSKDAFYFAAEAKAILAVCPELRRIDTHSMAEFVSFGCVLQNRTVFEGIHALPPASAWTFSRGALQWEAQYFHPKEWEEQERLEPEAYYQELRRIFSERLPRYFTGEERIGVSLTGGLDSRMIMAWAKAAPGSLPCYSFGGMFRDCQDVVMAREVAKACQQPYEVIQVGPEFLSQFPHYAERAVYLTDGCTAVNRSADLWVNERAREIAPVRMTGNYGGEVLRHVRAFKPEKLTDGVFCAEFSDSVSRAEDTYRQMSGGHPLSFAAFKQAPWHHYGLLALEETQLSLRSPYLDNELVRTVYRAPESEYTNEICLRLIADGDSTLRRIRSDLGIGGERGRLYAQFSQKLLKFTFKAEYAYDYGMLQWMARIDHSFSRLRLERIFLGRHKFAHFRVWYRDYLSNYVREMLLDPLTLSRPYLQKKGVEAIVRGHLKGDRNYTTAIHKLLTLELLHRLFIDHGVVEEGRAATAANIVPRVSANAGT